jgi:dihydrofolate reductase
MVDEYRLMVFPIVLGSGKRLFPTMKETATFCLVESKTTSSGIVMLTYHGSPGTGASAA